MNDHATISRREFLSRLSLLAGLAAVYPAAALERRRLDNGSAGHDDWQNTEPWKTLAAVQQHLFPADVDTPGAADIQAIVYLKNTIDNPAADAEDKTFISNGVGWLNALTQQSYQQDFTRLDEQQRETVLRQIETSTAGRNWLSTLLTYLLEALLADPVYGGNPQGIGWRWLAHQPGFPAPPENKTWYRLVSPLRDQRKA